MVRELLDKFEFVYIPKHGSWLNMAECEFSVLSRQCVDRRISNKKTLSREITAWQATRNTKYETGRLAIHYGRRTHEVEAPLP